jgi:hypothetical protein
MAVEDDKSHKPIEGVVEARQDSAVTESGATPVFDRLTELQAQLAEAQAALERRRANDRERSKRWRERDPDKARALAAARMRAHRDRKRQVGG